MPAGPIVNPCYGSILLSSFVCFVCFVVSPLVMFAGPQCTISPWAASPGTSRTWMLEIVFSAS